DPTKALEPARKKLSTIEAQRIMAVFEESIKRAEIVTALPYIMENMQRFRVSLGSELVELLNQHGRIQQSYKEARAQLDHFLEKRALLAKRIELKNAAAAAAAEAAAREKEMSAMENIFDDHSCKNILRLFSTNPTAMKVVTSEPGVRDEGGQDLVANMAELRDILMHKLLTTPEEETERMAYLDEISKRERQNAAIIEKQEKELKEAIDDKEEEIRKKNEIIKRLQTDLHQIEKFSDENIRRTRAEAEKQEIADTKNSDQKTQKLQAEINQLQNQLNNAISEHREIEADLRGKKYKIENEVDNWIQKYDQDLGERQDEYEEIDLVYSEEKKQLEELEERFATLEKEYTAIMEERRVARDKRERAQRELAILVKSATTIQAFWRSYKVRKALKAKNKKKGGKKKSA
ncbi:hypothetical protein EGW08_019853, partial [Elysia chlorotica]